MKAWRQSIQDFCMSIQVTLLQTQGLITSQSKLYSWWSRSIKVENWTFSGALFHLGFSTFWLKERRDSLYAFKNIIWLLRSLLHVCSVVSSSLWPHGLTVGPCTIAHQAPLSMEFSRQEYWSGLPFPSPGESSQPRDWIHVSYVSCIVKQILYHSATWEPHSLYWWLIILKLSLFFSKAPTTAIWL